MIIDELMNFHDAGDLRQIRQGHQQITPFRHRLAATRTITAGSQLNLLIKIEARPQHRAGHGHDAKQGRQQSQPQHHPSATHGSGKQQQASKKSTQHWCGIMPIELANVEQ